MATGSRYVMGGHGRYSAFPPGVKWLLISNIALFVVYYLAAHAHVDQAFYWLGLIPSAVLQLFGFWQLVTYMFLHDPWGFGHILFNMLTLWMFGKDLEATWGTRRFLKYYFICGIGAGICVVIGNAIFGTLNTRTIGASGAIYGLLLAFGMLFPDTTVLFSFLFPIKAKYFVMIIGAIAFLSTLGATGSGVSHVAHLGGMVFGYFYLKSKMRVRFGLLDSVGRKYQDWKFQRAKKKYHLYVRKRESDHNRFIH